MRAVLQQVSKASVSVDGHLISNINQGWLVLLGIHNDDNHKDIDYIVQKITQTRAFDNDGSAIGCIDAGKEVLLVSQFTLYGDLRKGRRPSFAESVKSEKAEKIYQDTKKSLVETGCRAKFGKFGAYMQVSLTNDGPFTLIVDSSRIL
ncbi:D-aminoacyl-tRNA deacylase [Oligoflexaceae bacterium]|nr:D-aminoacyl-tRNA deacylase [Oligoflexaceae bacterium]